MAHTTERSHGYRLAESLGHEEAAADYPYEDSSDSQKKPLRAVSLLEIMQPRPFTSNLRKHLVIISAKIAEKNDRRLRMIGITLTGRRMVGGLSRFGQAVRTRH